MFGILHAATWQDIVISIGQIFFSLALIPSIVGKNKPSFWTSLPTFVFLIAFCVAFATLDLIYGAITAGITALCWLILTIQTFNTTFHRRKPPP